MTGSVIPFPERRFADVPLLTAREIVSFPDFHDRSACLDACEVVLARGDWLEVEKARHLRAAILREPADAPRPFRHSRLALGGMFVAGAMVAFMGIALAELSLRNQAPEVPHHVQD